MTEASMRRVAVLGGVRIPFCRSHTAYAELSNLDMLTAALGGLVDRFALHGAHIDEVVGGAVVTHAKDWNLAREAVIGSALAPTTPGITMMQACGTSLAGALRHRRQDRHRTDRIGHLARHRHHQRRAGRVPAAIRPAPGEIVPRPQPWPEGRRLQRLHPGRAGAPAPFDLRAAHRAQHGRALRADGQGMGNYARSPRFIGL